MAKIISSSKTIVFIHGLFVTPKCWNEWRAYFEKQGYTCYAPATLFHDGEPATLRKNIDVRLGKVSFKDMVETVTKFIDVLPEKPILIGHSLGGLVVQKLISLNKGDAGICIDGAAPMGILTFEGSFWRSNFTVINYLKGNSVFEPTKKWFHYAFCNTMSAEESNKVFDEQVVPESRNIPRGTLMPYAKIDFKKAHQPLLFIAGEKDHIIPASLNRKNFNAYKNATSIKTFKEFKGRDHYICGEKDWQEVAEYCLNWLRS